MLELLGTALANVLHLKYLVPLFFGTLAGVIGGALPGVTITMTIIVVLPFTFGLDPLQGLAAMTGVYVGGSAGGLITAALIGIPGTPSAITTTFDGYPMAQKGEPGRAVWLGVWSSFFGGLLGGVFLILATGPLAAIALEFGPWEYLLAVRVRAVDGRRAHRGLARQGPALRRARAHHHHHRHRSDHERAALHPRHRDSRAAAFRSCRC